MFPTDDLAFPWFLLFQERDLALEAMSGEFWHLVNPIASHSKKIQKVAVGTLSAEGMALVGAEDMLSWIKLYWAWICDQRCNWRKAYETLLPLPAACS